MASAGIRSRVVLLVNRRQSVRICCPIEFALLQICLGSQNILIKLGLREGFKVLTRAQNAFVLGR